MNYQKCVSDFPSHWLATASRRANHSVYSNFWYTEQGIQRSFAALLTGVRLRLQSRRTALVKEITAGAKMRLRRARNIFMPANINSKKHKLYCFITLALIRSSCLFCVSISLPMSTAIDFKFPTMSATWLQRGKTYCLTHFKYGFGKVSNCSKISRVLSDRMDLFSLYVLGVSQGGGGFLVPFQHCPMFPCSHTFPYLFPFHKFAYNVFVL